MERYRNRKVKRKQAATRMVAETVPRGMGKTTEHGVGGSQKGDTSTKMVENGNMGDTGTRQEERRQQKRQQANRG